MRRLSSAVISILGVVVFSGCVVTASGPRYPNLIQARNTLQRAREHIHAAESAHAATGGLGNHGAVADQALAAAEGEINAAMAFADTHYVAGTPGVVTAKPPLTSMPDDARYPNLGDARLQTEWAMRHVDDAMQFHAPIGSLGGHGERALEHCRRALFEISQAERFIDSRQMPSGVMVAPPPPGGGVMVAPPPPGGTYVAPPPPGGTYVAPPPASGRYPHLLRAREALAQATRYVQAAEQAHARSGTLGGHGGRAIQAIGWAEAEIAQAMAFADSHTRPGIPGVVTARPPLTAIPDDVRYPNLGEARLQVEWAIRHVEEAMQYHGPIGSLGGHGERTIELCRNALREITEAERFSDTHRR